MVRAAPDLSLAAATAALGLLLALLAALLRCISDAAERRAEAALAAQVR